MGDLDQSLVVRAYDRRLAWVGVLLIVVGFLGHFFAARAIGTYIYYRDHIFGFFLILLVTGSIIAGLGWRFWKGRKDITLLIIGVVQALFGIAIYTMRFHIHRRRLHVLQRSPLRSIHTFHQQPHRQGKFPRAGRDKQGPYRRRQW